MNDSPPITRREAAAVAALLILQIALLTSLAWRIGVTIDEPSHLLSSYLWWQGNDRLYPGDMPPLIKMVGGWAPSLTGLPVPYDHESWRSQKEWDTALEMMGRMSAPQIQSVFFSSRLTLLIFPVACSLVLWHWTRRMFSPLAGILATLMFSISPTVLAHGSLFKNDLAATLGYLLFWYRAWLLWRSPGIRNTAWLAAAVLVAMLAKMSLLIVALIAPVIVVLAFVREQPAARATVPMHAGRRVLSELQRTAVALLVLFVIPYIGVNAAWQFDSRPLTASDWGPWKALPTVPDAFIFAAQTIGRLPTPPALWHGVVSLFESNATAAPVYLLGEVHPHGHPFYFLIALGLKLPVPLQLLVAAGLVISIAGLTRRRLPATHLFWMAPPVLYITLASFSDLQLGIRLVLPAIGFLFVYAAIAIQWCRPRRYAMIVPVVLIAWLGVRAVQRYPRYISYFNLWAGGPENAIDLLSDSNLDWGQNLRTLARIVEREKIPKIRLSYFGADNPWAYFSDKNMEILAPPWSVEYAKGTRLQPEPGYYAISVTLLTGQFFADPYRDYYAEFRKRKPFARAGYSINLYKIP